MTTIAWDGRVLAADRQTNDGGVPLLTEKIVDHAQGHLTGCGDCDRIRTVQAWVMRYLDGTTQPETFPPGSDDATVIHVSRAGEVAVYERSGYPQRLVRGERHAWGSGRMAALAAMECGRSAAEAVLIAGKFDRHTGLGVSYRQFDKPPQAWAATRPADL